MIVIEVTPGPLEVAVARVPAGMALRTVRGDTDPFQTRPEELAVWAAVPGTGLGWGCVLSTWYGPAGIANGHHARDREWWYRAARMVGWRTTASRLDPVVVYVIHEQRDWYGRPVWVAVSIRREGEQ